MFSGFFFWGRGIAPLQKLPPSKINVPSLPVKCNYKDKREISPKLFGKNPYIKPYVKVQHKINSYATIRINQYVWVLTKFVRSRWLDIGQVLFLRVYRPRRSRGPYTCKKRTRPISSHLDRTNLVNKRFIIWLLGKFILRDTAGSPERAR